MSHVEVKEVVNPEKERAKIHLNSSMGNNLTLLLGFKGKMDAAIALLAQELGNFPSGLDRDAQAILQRSGKTLEDVAEFCKKAKELTSQLEVIEKIEIVVND